MADNNMKITDLFNHWKDHSFHNSITSTDLQKYVTIINQANLESEADVSKFIERLESEERGEGFVLDSEQLHEEGESRQEEIDERSDLENEIDETKKTSTRDKLDENTGLENEAEMTFVRESSGIDREAAIKRAQERERIQAEARNEEFQEQIAMAQNQEAQRRLSTEKHESLLIMKKLVLLKVMFKKVQEKTEADLVKINPELAGKISWTHTLSCGAGKAGITCVMPNQNGKNESIFINANVNELLKLPGECALAYMLGKVQTVLMNPKQKQLANNYTALVNNSIDTKDLEFGNDDMVALLAGKRKAIVKALAQHFSRIFPAEFSDLVKMGLYTAKGCNALALYAANAIASEMSDEELKKFSEGFFNFQSLESIAEILKEKDLKAKGISVAEQFIYGDAVTLSRIYNINHGIAEKGDLLRDVTKGVTEPGQANELLKRYVDTAFMRKHQAKMMDPNKKKGDYTQADIQEFCEDYTDKFTKAYNLKPIKLEYVTSGGDKGTYVDFGRTSVIRINVKKVENIVDLMATLTHELTHYADSSRNKVAGKYNSRTGGGLEWSVNDLDLIQAYKIYCKEAEQKSEKPKPFKQFKNDYYMTNPDELHARESESEILKHCASLLLTEKEDEQIVSDDLVPFVENIIIAEADRLDRDTVRTYMAAGLTEQEARQRVEEMGSEEITPKKKNNPINVPVVEEGQIKDSDVVGVVPVVEEGQIKDIDVVVPVVEEEVVSVLDDEMVGDSIDLEEDVYRVPVVDEGSINIDDVTVGIRFGNNGTQISIIIDSYAGTTKKNTCETRKLVDISQSRPRVQERRVDRGNGERVGEITTGPKFPKVKLRPDEQQISEMTENGIQRE